jgi:hypothetical protein
MGVLGQLAVGSLAEDLFVPGDIPIVIPYADNSDTFSNIWKLRAIRLFRG